jgi:hypothetical protein
LSPGFKLCKDGLTTIINEESYIVGYYLGTSSLLSLAPYLAHLGLRSKALGKVCAGTRACLCHLKVVQAVGVLVVYEGCVFAARGLCNLQVHICKAHGCWAACADYTCGVCGQPPDVGKILKAIFPDLGLGLVDGDGGLRWDEFHMILLIRKTTVGGHPS